MRHGRSSSRRRAASVRRTRTTTVPADGTRRGLLLLRAATDSVAHTTPSSNRRPRAIVAPSRCALPSPWRWMGAKNVIHIQVYLSPLFAKRVCSSLPSLLTRKPRAWGMTFLWFDVSLFCYVVTSVSPEIQYYCSTLENQNPASVLEKRTILAKNSCIILPTYN